MLFSAVFNIKKSSCVLGGEDIGWNPKSIILRQMPFKFLKFLT